MRLITVLRKQKDMKQFDVARVVNTSRSTISALERGAISTSATRFGTVKAIEDLFGLPIDQLMAEVRVAKDGSLHHTQ